MGINLGKDEVESVVTALKPDLLVRYTLTDAPPSPRRGSQNRDS